MKMAFELNDLKGLLFLVLLTIPSTLSTNYDCKGKSFYCLDSTHFLICVDFGDGVLSTIDNFVLPCPSLTECHESNTYECELPKIVPKPVVHATSVTEKNYNNVVPLTKTATIVPLETTITLPSTEKTTVVSVSEVVTTESNKELLESIKEQFSGGNEHFFDPTKFTTTNSIGLSVSPNIEHVNKTNTTNAENKINISVKTVPKLIDITTSFEELLVTDSNEPRVIPKSPSATQNNPEKELSIIANELTQSKNLTSDEFITIEPPTLPSKLNTDGAIGITVLEKSDVTPTVNIAITVPYEVTTVPPSTEKNTITPLEIVTFETNKEVLEKIKDQFTGGNEKIFEHPLFMPPNNISSGSGVDKIDNTSTTADKKNNTKPGIEHVTKIIDVITSVNGLPVTNIKEPNVVLKSLNITHDNANTGDSNITTNEITKLIGDEALAITLPTPSSTSLAEISDHSVMPVISTMTTVPLEVTTVLPSTEKRTDIPTLKVATSKFNKELLEKLKDEFTGGNEKVFEPNNFEPPLIINSKPRMNKVNDTKTTGDKTNNPISGEETSTKVTWETVVTDSPKNIDFTTSTKESPATDFKDINSTPRINKEGINIMANERIETDNWTNKVTEANLLPTELLNINTSEGNAISIFQTSDNTVAPLEVTTALSSTEQNTVMPALELNTSNLNKEVLESLKDKFTGGNEKIFELTTTSVPPYRISLNLSATEVNDINSTTNININPKGHIVTSTENKVKNSVIGDTKILDTPVDGILIHTTYTPTLQNINHTTSDTRELNVIGNLTRDKAPANMLLALSSNLNSDQKYDLDKPPDNITSFSNQTNYNYSLQNFTTPIFTKETTVNSVTVTEKVPVTLSYSSYANGDYVTESITKININLNTSDEIIKGRNLAPEEQKDFLSNQSMQFENSTKKTPFEIPTPTATSDHLQIEKPNGTEPFIRESDKQYLLISKYETINNIDKVYTTFSTTESNTNMGVNHIGQNIDVLNNNGTNNYRTTVSNTEQTTEVTSTTPTDTTTETQTVVIGDNILTTSITTHDQLSTTTENSITSSMDFVNTPDTYVNKNENYVLKMSDTEEILTNKAVKSTTPLIKSSFNVTPSQQNEVTKSTFGILLNGKGSSLENQIKITTSNTTTSQSKIYEKKSELVVTTTEHLNSYSTKASIINGSEDWSNTNFIRANNLSNIDSLTTKKTNGANEKNNVALNYEIKNPSVLKSTIKGISTTDPNVMNNEQTIIQNTGINTNGVPTISTLPSIHKSNVVPTKTMHITSFTMDENIDNKPTEAPINSKTLANAATITKVVTPSQYSNTVKTDIESLTLTQINSEMPTVIYTQNVVPNLKIHKVVQQDVFSTTVQPITEELGTTEKIARGIKLTSPTLSSTENPMHFTTELPKLNYVKKESLTTENIMRGTKLTSVTLSSTEIPMHSVTELPKINSVKIMSGYSKPDSIASTKETNIESVVTSSLTSTKTVINGSNIKKAGVVKDLTLKQSTVPESRGKLHTVTTTRPPTTVIETETTYHSNILVSHAVTGFSVQQKPNIAVERMLITPSTSKPNTDNISGISTVQTSNSTTINNTEYLTESLSKTKPVNFRIPKSILDSKILTENIFNNDTVNNSIYSTNLKMRDENNTTIKEALQTTNLQISGNNSNKGDINLETTTNAFKTTLLNIDIGGKSKDGNDNEDNESSTPYKSALHIEMTTPSILDYKTNRPEMNIAQNTKSQTLNINISKTEIFKKDSDLKMMTVKAKAPGAAVNKNNKGQTNNSIPTFDCQNKTRGKYGDNKDCQKFYTCIGTLQPIVGICPNHTVFSEINKQCTRNLSHCVRNNQFHCLYEGRFSDFFKDNVYYICVKNNFHGFLRYKLQCQDGYYLNKAIVKCERKVEIYKESMSSFSENSKMTTDQNKSSVKSDESEKSVSDFECKKEGLFPYPNDCRKYFECSKNKKDEYRRKIKICSIDEVYDKEKKKCVFADSIEC